jgi:hypothetical protein
MLAIPKMVDDAVVRLKYLGQEPGRRASAHVLAESLAARGHQRI